MQVKKQQLELHMEQQTGSKLAKEYVKAVYFHPANLTYMRNARLDEAQAEIKIAGRNVNNLRYGRKQRRTEEPLDESEKGEWKSWFKTQHSKT